MTNLRKKKKPRFKDIKEEHIAHMKSLMEKRTTRDLSLDKKLLLMKRKFPQLPLSRSTLWNVYLLYLLKILRYKGNLLGIPLKGYLNMYRRIILLLTVYWRGYTLLKSFFSISKMRELNYLCLMKLVNPMIPYSYSVSS